MPISFFKRLQYFGLIPVCFKKVMWHFELLHQEKGSVRIQQTNQQKPSLYDTTVFILSCVRRHIHSACSATVMWVTELSVNQISTF